MKDQILHYN